MEPKSLYVSSPRSDKVASQGLGGMQGLILVGGLIALVAFATLGVATTGTERELATYANDVDFSLKEIAASLGRLN